jgi:hypothetical protein
MHIYNIVYDQLLNHQNTYDHFVWRVKETIAETAGYPLTGHDVSLYLQAGSVYVKGYVYTPEQHSDTVTANLYAAGKNGQLDSAITAKVQGTPGIHNVKTGTIRTVSNYVDHLPIVPTQPPTLPPASTTTPFPNNTISVRRRRSVPIIKGSSQFNYGFSAVLLALALVSRQAASEL